MVDQFRPTLESLSGFQCPEWFRDAKFGIWSHWGPQSVPMFGDWYARHMYCEGTAQYRHHWRIYGHPSQSGYKEIIQQWRAENFAPDELMELFTQAGARYFVAQATHHDNFFNFDSKLHRWNSVEMGPRKDIVGLWKAAAEAHGIPFGVTEHYGAAFTWAAVNKGHDKTGPFANVPYDGTDPAYQDLYLQNQEHYDPDRTDWRVPLWYTTNTAWHQRWLEVMNEIIDQYEPELLYSDGPPPFGETGLQAIAHLYNASAARHDGVNQAIYNHKDASPQFRSIGIFDVERSQVPELAARPWQTDTSVGDWFYNVRDVYKQPHHVIEMLVDIVAKNGNLLLNIPQRPDGTIDDECREILNRLGKWTQVCGEGIYGTRPFAIYGEGPSGVRIEGFTEEPVAWTSADFRFTQKGNTVYAFQMHWPDDHRAIIRSLPADRSVQSVRLLGSNERLPFTYAHGILIAALPQQPPAECANCLAIELTA